MLKLLYHAYSAEISGSKRKDIGTEERPQLPRNQSVLWFNHSRQRRGMNQSATFLFSGAAQRAGRSLVPAPRCSEYADIVFPFLPPERHPERILESVF